MKGTKKNEILLLIFLGVVLLVYLFINYAVKPKLESIDQIEAQISSEDMIVRGLYSDILKYNTDSKRLKEYSDATAQYLEKFYINENQETYLSEICQVLYDMDFDFSLVESEDYRLSSLPNEGFRTISPYVVYASDTLDMEVNLPSTEDLGESETPTSEPAEETSQDENLGLTALSSGEINVDKMIETMDIPEVYDMYILIKATGNPDEVPQLIDRLNAMGKYKAVSNFSYEESNPDDPENNEAVLSIGIEFLTLKNTGNMILTEDVPPLPEGFVMPTEFISGEYKNVNIIKDLFKKIN